MKTTFWEWLGEYWFALGFYSAFIFLLLLTIVFGIFCFTIRNDPKPIVRYYISTPVTNYVVKELYQHEYNGADIFLEDGRHIQLSGTYSVEKKVVGYTKK